MSSAADFVGSGRCFVELIRSIPVGEFGREAIEGWTVRSLAGHAARAILTVQTYLDRDEPDRITIPDAEHYYSSVYPALFDYDHFHSDGISAGEWLGDDPAGHASDALASTCAAIDAQLPGRIVSIGGMGIALGEYLRTRVVELVLHTMDLAAAVGIDHRLPDAAVQAASELAASIPTRLRHGEERLVVAGVAG